ncbi:MAG TPA: helicase C-terminal domain-containing protein [Candidatus Nanoarchaeia archaeon]|nr:helicase C-terminal domain-containing protein [Candidatus Nanoarchaeia archaeon]
MQLYFPHETIRPSQKEMTEKILDCITKKQHLLVHAPTGLGKTAAALSSALSYSLSNPQKKLTIFFVTPKHTQHKIAIETLRTLKERHSLNLEVIDLIGKRWMCIQPGVTDMPSSDFSDYCKTMIKNNACQYYANLGPSHHPSFETKLTLQDLKGKILHVEELKEKAQTQKLCPYEITILLGKKAQIVIADYLHLLTPSIRTDLLEKLGKKLDQAIIIFDEAHNLPDKSREVLSTQLSTLTLEHAAKEAAGLGHKEIGEDVLKLKQILESLAQTKTGITETEAVVTKEEFINQITFINYEELTNNIAFIAAQTREHKEKSAAGAVAEFLTAWPGPDHAFVRILTKGFTTRGRAFLTLSYNCLDPSILLKPLAEESHTIIAMSGTLTPLEMYQDLFGFPSTIQSYPNPFPQTNKLSLILPDTTTKYTLRDTAMFQRIAAHCATITNIIPGNSAIFFPSYHLRDEIYKHFQHQCEKTSFLEQARMTKQEKTDMLENFKKYNHLGAVLLGASSGNFGEGIDLKDNILKCVIIVGLPLSKPDIQTQALIHYYDFKFNKGWDYGYNLPALIRCFQNAGRAIRSATDKGVIIYLDERYTWQTYFKAFPKDEQFKINKEPLATIKEFFSQKQ